MNTSQYNYFIDNEPNFQTINDWENNYAELELFSEKPENSQYFEQNLKPVAGLDPESEFLKTFNRS